MRTILKLSVLVAAWLALTIAGYMLLREPAPDIDDTVVSGIENPFDQWVFTDISGSAPRVAISSREAYECLETSNFGKHCTALMASVDVKGSAAPVVAKDVFAELDRRIEEQARDATARGEVDREMLVGETYAVRLVVDRNSPDQPSAMLARTPEATAFELPTKVSMEVRSRIGAAGFDVMSAPDEWRTLPTKGSVAWEWEVSPRAAGDKIITFFLDHRITEGAVTRVITASNFPNVVTVRVGSWQYVRGIISEFGDFAASLKGLLTTVVALVVLVMGWLGWRGRAPQTP